MQAFIAYAPVVAFFVTYSLRGLYTATAVLMAAMLALLVFDWVRQRRIPPMHALSTVLVLIFGSATLVLHNRLFIQWKPTVLFWLLALAFLGSFWIGAQTLTERMLTPALEGQLQASPTQWRILNGSSVLFYAALGGLNLLVAYQASERTWVYFKLIGLTLLSVVFVLLQVLWLRGRANPLPAAPAPEAPR
jgi:intracellular septation protein